MSKFADVRDNRDNRARDYISLLLLLMNLLIYANLFYGIAKFYVE